MSNFNKLCVTFGNRSPSFGVGRLTDAVDVCRTVHTLSVLGTGCCFRACAHNYIHKVIVPMLLLGSYSQAPECRQSETVDAFCRQCVRGGAFYGALFVTCLKGCCCKSCVIHKKQVLLSARFHLHKPLRRTNRVWPAAIPPWNFFLYQTALLSTLPFALFPPPTSPAFISPRCCVCLCTGPVMLFSLTGLHGKYLAADACGRLLPGHVCLPLSSGSMATQRENCSIHGDEGGVLGVGYLNVVDRRI